MNKRFFTSAIASIAAITTLFLPSVAFAKTETISDVQFTRLQFSGQTGSGIFPSTGGASGDYATYFKINTKGSYCPEPSPMPFSGNLSY